MPEGKGYGPQSTTSVGELNVIGKHAYAYSGIVSVDDTETTLIEFRTGNYYLVGKITFGTDSRSPPDYLHTIYINNIPVQLVVQEDRPGRSGLNYPLLIAPFSIVKFTADNVESSASHNKIVTMVAKIYGKVE